jgi:hypothetical protein
LKKGLRYVSEAFFIIKNIKPMSPSFPQYRKYSNNRNFFKINSAEDFEEISFIGSKRIVRQYRAAILPDRNLIHDLLHDPAFAETITEEEYMNQLNAGL